MIRLLRYIIYFVCKRKCHKGSGNWGLSSSSCVLDRETNGKGSCGSRDGMGWVRSDEMR